MTGRQTGIFKMTLELALSIFQCILKRLKVLKTRKNASKIVCPGRTDGPTDRIVAYSPEARN